MHTAFTTSSDREVETDVRCVLPLVEDGGSGVVGAVLQVCFWALIDLKHTDTLLMTS